MSLASDENITNLSLSLKSPEILSGVGAVGENFPNPTNYRVQVFAIWNKCCHLSKLHDLLWRKATELQNVIFVDRTISTVDRTSTPPETTGPVLTTVDGTSALNGYYTLLICDDIEYLKNNPEDLAE